MELKSRTEAGKGASITSEAEALRKDPLKNYVDAVAIEEGLPELFELVWDNLDYVRY